MAKKAVLLLSGGLDSATVLAMAKAQDYAVYAMSFSYGQRHVFELSCAKTIARNAGVAQHRIVEIDLGIFGASALTDNAIAVPKHRSHEQISGGIPVTYVPARNTLFLSYALAWAEVLGAFDIFLGVNALDYSGYPDCRAEYLAAFERMANLALAATQSAQKLHIHAPLLEMTKEQIIRAGLALGVDYGQTISCYDPDSSGKPCGACDACSLRAKGFAGAGVIDPGLKD